MPAVRAAPVYPAAAAAATSLRRAASDPGATVPQLQAVKQGTAGQRAVAKKLKKMAKKYGNPMRPRVGVLEAAAVLTPGVWRRVCDVGWPVSNHQHYSFNTSNM